MCDAHSRRLRQLYGPSDHPTQRASQPIPQDDHHDDASSPVAVDHATSSGPETVSDNKNVDMDVDVDDALPAHSPESKSATGSQDIRAGGCSSHLITRARMKQYRSLPVVEAGSAQRPERTHRMALRNRPDTFLARGSDRL